MQSSVARELEAHADRDGTVQESTEHLHDFGALLPGKERLRLRVIQIGDVRLTKYGWYMVIAMRFQLQPSWIHRPSWLLPADMRLCCFCVQTGLKSL